MEEKRKRKYEEGKTIIADPNRFVSAIRFVPSSKKQRALETERNASISFQEFLNENAPHTTQVPIYDDSWGDALTREPDENVLTAIQQGPVPVYDPRWKSDLVRHPDEKGGRKRRTKKYRNSKKHGKTKKSKRKMSFKKKTRKSKK